MTKEEFQQLLDEVLELRQGLNRHDEEAAARVADAQAAADHAIQVAKEARDAHGSLETDYWLKKRKLDQALAELGDGLAQAPP